MTPDQVEQFNDMLRKVGEMYEWMQARKVQQLSLPVDDASRNALGAAVGIGPGSTTKTQSVSISSTPTSINVPAPYIGTEIVLINGVQREIPYIA